MKNLFKIFLITYSFTVCFPEDVDFKKVEKYFENHILTVKKYVHFKPSDFLNNENHALVFENFHLFKIYSASDELVNTMPEHFDSFIRFFVYDKVNDNFELFSYDDFRNFIINKLFQIDNLEVKEKLYILNIVFHEFIHEIFFYDKMSEVQFDNFFTKIYSDTKYEEFFLEPHLIEHADGHKEKMKNELRKFFDLGWGVTYSVHKIHLKFYSIRASQYDIHCTRWTVIISDGQLSVKSHKSILR